MLRPLSLLQKHRAETYLRAVAVAWSAFTSHAASRFLAISLNSNALERSRSLLTRYRPEEVKHLELLRFGEHGRATPQQLRDAREAAAQQIPRLELDAGDLRVEILAKAQLPLLLWLGLRLRYLRRVTLFNDSGRQPSPFTGPSELIRRPRAERPYAQLLPKEAAQSAESVSHPNHAVVIIDFRSRSTEAQLDAFRDVEGRLVQPSTRARLVPRGEVQDLTGDLQLQEVITDVLQYLYALHDQGIKRIHLALIGPDALVFFLGQQLNAWTISLYEFYSGEQPYQYVFDLTE